MNVTGSPFPRNEASPIAALAKAALVALLATILLAGCAASGVSSDGEEQGVKNEEPKEAAQTNSDDGSVTIRAGDAEVTVGGGSAVARAGDAVAEPGVEGTPNTGQNASEEAVLKLEGDPGTKFDLACAAGDEREELAGKVPERFVYDLAGAGLACDIRKKGPGNLKITLTAGNNRTIRETNAENVLISLVYTNGNIIASQSSGSSVSSSNVQIQSSNSSVQQSSSSQSVSVIN